QSARAFSGPGTRCAIGRRRIRRRTRNEGVGRHCADDRLWRRALPSLALAVVLDRAGGPWRPARVGCAYGSWLGQLGAARRLAGPVSALGPLVRMWSRNARSDRHHGARCARNQRRDRALRRRWTACRVRAAAVVAALAVRTW